MDPENSVRVWDVGRRVLTFFSLEINIFQRGQYGPPLRSYWTASQGVSVPEFLRKPIAACDFPGVCVWGGGGGGSRLDPPMIHSEQIFINS